MDKKAVVEIKIVDKLDLPVGEFVGGFRNSKRGARCALFDSLSRRRNSWECSGISGGANGVPH